MTTNEQYIRLAGICHQLKGDRISLTDDRYQVNIGNNRIFQIFGFNDKEQSFLVGYDNNLMYEVNKVFAKKLESKVLDEMIKVAEVILKQQGLINKFAI